MVLQKPVQDWEQELEAELETFYDFTGSTRRSAALSMRLKPEAFLLYCKSFVTLNV